MGCQSMTFSPAEAVNQILRKKSIETLKAHTKGDISLVDIEKKDDFIYAPMMVFILIHGKSFRITFKVHYYLTAARKLASSSINSSEEKVTNSLTDDFMKEYCNLIGGELKGSINKLGISVGTTFPFIISGFDEVLFSDHLSRSSVQDYWQLKWAPDSITCTSVIEAHNPEIFQGIDSVPSTNKDKNGEIVFL